MMAEVYAPDNSRSSKEEAHYRPKESCQLCTHFIPPANRCEVVEGNISPDAVCDKFALVEKTEYYDKEFFLKELEKNKE
jgi:hypothetical protein